MKNQKRIKITQSLPLLQSRDEAEAAMNDLACAANNKRQVLARRDAEILDLNTKYEAGLAALDLDLQKRADILRAWAEANPDQFPKDRKSITMTSGTLGFRTGTPKLALLSRAWTWIKVLAAVQQTLPNFVRSKPEIDKEALLAQRTESTVAWAIAKCGMKVTQEETFFVEPDLAKFDPRQTVEAA